MLEIKKSNNHYYFTKADKILKTKLNSAISLKSKKTAIKLSKYLSLCYSCKDKEKKFFLEMLYFSYDLNKKNKEYFINKIISFLNSDCLCYRADANTEIEELQKKIWDPLINFVKHKYRLTFSVINGVMPIKQDPKNILILASFLKKLKSFDFTIYYFITNFSNSNIIALNFLSNNIISDHAWSCLNLEETYSLKKWGQDKEAKNKLSEKKKYFNEIVNFKILLKNQEIHNE